MPRYNRYQKVKVKPMVPCAYCGEPVVKRGTTLYHPWCSEEVRIARERKYDERRIDKTAKPW